MNASPAPSGDSPAELTTDELFAKLYDQLRKIAAQRMANERVGDTLQATALVNEAWIRLNGDRVQNWRDEDHLISAASEAMRRILVDRARKKRTLKNGGEMRRTELDIEKLEQAELIRPDHLEIHESLERFTSLHPEHAQLLELHFFAGLKLKEIAALTAQSEKTIRRHWVYSRAWLYDAIKQARKARADG